ncbi:FMN reductase [Pilimelia terevasa]|uniref:FMN reductase n=1 Tax=Pilimelia terevasa TaxID=53372 RepID=A0A8J3FFP2_9ACTN|nr:NADPH-dependent FMN reductase [Pilimelia terevasa]GGK21797.1 FMN reductase [Pilimelia terevasa]
MTSLQIIVASTRPGRIGLPIGQWCAARAEKHGAFDVELVDLAQWNLPMMDEPHHPRLRRYTHQHTRDWSAKVDAAEAFVFVMPEYNYGYTAPLKNALDYLWQEWQNKPVGLLSYGGIAAGTRALQLLRPVLSGMHLVPLPEMVSIPFAGKAVSDGVFTAPEPAEDSLAAMLDSLARWADTLRAHRAGA